MSKVILTKEQAELLDHYAKDHSAEELVMIRVDYDTYAHEHADLFEMDLETLMHALVRGYEYRLSVKERWEEVYANSLESAKFFGGYDNLVRERHLVRAETIAAMDADFSLGLNIGGIA